MILTYYARDLLQIHFFRAYHTQNMSQGVCDVLVLHLKSCRYWDSSSCIIFRGNADDFPWDLSFVSFFLKTLTEYARFIWWKTDIDNVDVLLWATHPELAYYMPTLGWGELISEDAFSSPLTQATSPSEGDYPVRLREMVPIPSNNSIFLQMLM